MSGDHGEIDDQSVRHTAEDDGVLGWLDQIDRALVIEWLLFGVIPVPRRMRRAEKAVLRERVEALINRSDSIADMDGYFDETQRLMQEARRRRRVEQSLVPHDGSSSAPRRRGAMTALVIMLAPHRGEAIIGDLDQQLAQREQIEGVEAAHRWYRRKMTFLVLRMIACFVIRSDALIRAFEDLTHLFRDIF